MRIDGLIQGQALNVSNLTDILSKLNLGDVLRAQVLEIMANEVLLKLFDGTTLKAATLADLDARKGEFANFIVKNKIENQILLEQMKNSGTVKDESLQEVLLKQLSAMGMEANDQNLEIAENMNKNFVPFRKELFDSALEMMGKFKDLGAAKAVFLASNQLAANEQNIEALSQLTTTKVQVGTEVEQLIKSLEQAEGKAPSAASDPRPSSLNRSLTNQEIQQMIETELASNKNRGLADVIKGFDLKGKIQEYVEKAIHSPVHDIGEGISSFIKSIPAMLRPAERVALTNLLERLVGRVNTGDTREIESLTRESTEKLKEVKNELEKIFIKIGDPSKLERELDVSRAYKELFRNLENLKEAVSSGNLPGREDLLQKAENLQNNLRFINSINNHNSYIQIPLNVMDKNSTGELYILKRESKRKKIDPENTTMLIALDTQNIGRIESLITVNKKNITLNIRVEDQKIIDFLKGTYKELYQRIQDKGYKLVDVKYRLIDQSIDLLNVNEVVTRELNQGKKSLDIKV